jgi:hypothetical protein
MKNNRLVNVARLAAIVAALTILGCKGGGQLSAASASTGGTKDVSVPDTTMNNTTAYTVTIPASWNFKGVLMQGGVPTCQSYAYAVWRATSADGQSYVEQMPQMMWAYGTGPKPASGCLPLNGPMTAQDFVKFLAKSMQLSYVSDEPVAAADNAAVQKQLQDTAASFAARNLPPPKNTLELAQGNVSFNKGSVAMQGRMSVQLSCTETDFPGFKSILVGMASKPATASTKCTASAMFRAAPQGQLAAVLQMWTPTSMGFHENIPWGNAWVQRYAQQSNAQNQAMIRSADDAIRAGNAQIAQTMQLQQQEHDQFLSAMQQSTDNSMANANAAMNARSTAASDVVDFALNQQTVVNTNNGQLMKIPNQITPGGALQPTHGNGTPY